MSPSHVLGYDFHHARCPHFLLTQGFHIALRLASDENARQLISAGPTRANGYIMPRSGCSFYSQKPISNYTQKSQSFSHYRTMSGPPDGKYLIVLAGNSAPPPFPVGANEQGATSPVVVGGRDHVVSPLLPFSTTGACMIYPIPLLLAFPLDDWCAECCFVVDCHEVA